MAPIAMVFIGALMAGASEAPPPAPAVSPALLVITNPDWLRKPTFEEMANLYPVGAGPNGGSVRMKCLVTARGTLDKCAVISEAPAGRGFGSAALAMAPNFLMRPQTVNGEPIGGASVVIPINFQAVALENMASVPVARELPWEATPTADELAAAFPAQAAGKFRYGHVVLRCRVKVNRILDDCGAVSEDPTGGGFSKAAKALTRSFRVQAGADVLSTPDLHVDLPFDFRDPAKAKAPVEIYDAQWLQGPAPDEVAKLFPAAATKAGLRTGLGTVDCQVLHTGALDRCAAVAEDPQGMGFGDAAVAVSKDFTMNPWTKQGFPVDGAHVRLPIRLTLDAPSPAPFDPSAGTITNPHWIKKPDGDDMAHYFPDRALRRNQSGMAKMKCGVTADGHLQDCIVLYEDPAGLGFGSATLQLAHLFQMKPPAPLDAFPPGETVVLPCRWVVPGG